MMELRITDERAAKIAAREAKATKGPWIGFNTDDRYCMNIDGVRAKHQKEPLDESDLEDVVCVVLLQTDGKVATKDQKWDANKDFIAASRQDIPDLLADRQTMLAEIGTLIHEREVLWAIRNDLAMRITEQDAEIKRLKAELETPNRSKP